MPADLRDPAAIWISGLTIRFGALRALDDVSMSVPPGSITGLVGRNGAGKTTCIRCLAGLLTAAATESSVEIFGLRMPGQRAEILRKTGFLLSDPALFRYLTPAETLQAIGRAYGLPAAETTARSADLIAFFDLTEAATRLVDGFSTGMLKRLALAAALIHSPPLLVLDEPFESLDPLMVREMKRLLTDYSAAGGTVLLSSHLISAVEEICDRVVILEQGKVIVAGETRAVTAELHDRLPEATLEDLYATLLQGEDKPPMQWLLGGSGND